MKIEDIFKLLKTTGLEVAYNSFPDSNCPTPPFIVWRCGEQDNFFADNRTYQETQTIYIELITIRKDLESERKIKKVLKDFSWTSYEFQDEKEDYFRKIYEMEVIIND